MAEVNVYRVDYEIRFNRGEWIACTKTVLANGSAEAAIAKCRKVEMADGWTDDDTGKKHKATGWRLAGVERIMDIDLP